MHVSVNDLILAAVMRGDAQKVQEMIAHGASAHATYDHGSTLLHWAVRIPDDEASVQVLAVLLAAGADPNGRSADGRTPLHLAVLEENEAAARMLASQGADPSAADGEGRSPRDLALEAGLVGEEGGFTFLMAPQRGEGSAAAGAEPANGAAPRQADASSSAASAAVPSAPSASVRRSVACRTDDSLTDFAAPPGPSLVSIATGDGGLEGAAAVPSSSVTVDASTGPEPSSEPAAAPAPSPPVAPAPMSDMASQHENSDAPPHSNGTVPWPLALKFARNTNPAGRAAPPPPASDQASTSGVAYQNDATEVDEYELDNADVSVITAAVGQVSVSDDAAPPVGNGAGEVHVYGNALRYIRLELTASEPMLFSFGGPEAEEPAAPPAPEPHPAPASSASDPPPPAPAPYTVAYFSEGPDGDATAAAPVQREPVRVRLGPGGALSQEDYQRIKRA